MSNRNQQAIPIILEAVLGHPERYSVEQVSFLETGLHQLRKETKREEENMENMNDADCTVNILNAIDVA